MSLVWLPLLACTPAETETLSEAALHENPHSVIAPFLRWRTEAPGSSWVKYSDGEKTWLVGQDDTVTAHEVALIGMRAEVHYSATPFTVLVDGTTQTGPTLDYDTQPLPFATPDLQIGRFNVDRVQNGWTLFNLGLDHFINSPSIAAMVNPEGEMVWYRALGDGLGAAAVEASWCGDRVSLGGCVAPGEKPAEVDLAGRLLWEGWEQPPGLLDTGAMHHTMECPRDGERIALFYEKPEGIAYDVVMGLDDAGEVTWSWRADPVISEAIDEHIHLNKLLTDDTHLWVNSLRLQQFIAIDRASGALEWRFGIGGDFTLTEGTWFEGAHGTEWVDDTHLLMYDNAGKRDEADPGRPYSRAVEYELDLAARTARQVWAFPEEPEPDSADYWHNWIWGDADRLENGNTLINAGSLMPGDSQNRILEVSPEGEVVWELIFGREDPLSGSYAAARVPAFAQEIEE